MEAPMTVSLCTDMQKRTICSALEDGELGVVVDSDDIDGPCPPTGVSPSGKEFWQRSEDE